MTQPVPASPVALPADPDGPLPDAPIFLESRSRRWNEGWGILFWICSIYLVVLFILSMTSTSLPFIKDAYQIQPVAGSSPSASFPLGLDTIGRDVLSRALLGGRLAFTVGVVSIILGTIIGGGLGMIAGYSRGKLDAVITAVMDMMLAFPSIILAVAIVAFLEPSTTSVVLALTGLSIPYMARLARTHTIATKDREHVLAARVMGASKKRVIMHEILPVVWRALVSFAFTFVAVVIVTESVLSFVGLSVPAPQPTWGGMINEGRNQIASNPWFSLTPALVLLSVVIALNIIGDKFQSRYNVKEAVL